MFILLILPKLPSQDISKDELLEVIKYKSSLINTFGFQYSLFYLPQESYKGKGIPDKGMSEYYFYRYKGEKRFVSVLDEKGETIGIKTFDGQNSYLLNPAKVSQKLEKKDSLVMQSGFADEINCFLSPRWFFDQILDIIPLEPALLMKQTTVKKDGENILAEVSIGDGAIKCNVWLSPKLDYAIVKTDSYIKGIASTKAEVLDFKNIEVNGHNIYIPIHIVSKRYDYWTDGHYIYSEECKVENIEINKDYPDDLFKQTAGTNVSIWNRDLKEGFSIDLTQEADVNKIADTYIKNDAEQQGEKNVIDDNQDQNTTKSNDVINTASINITAENILKNNVITSPDYIWEMVIIVISLFVIIVIFLRLRYALEIKKRFIIIICIAIIAILISIFLMYRINHYYQRDLSNQQWHINHYNNILYGLESLGKDATLFYKEHGKYPQSYIELKGKGLFLFPQHNNPSMLYTVPIPHFLERDGKLYIYDKGPDIGQQARIIYDPYKSWGDGTHPLGDIVVVVDKDKYTLLNKWYK